MIKKLIADYQFSGSLSYYQIGEDEVTKITYEEFFPEVYCSRRIYKVFKGDKLFCEIYDSAVAEVIYKRGV